MLGFRKGFEVENVPEGGEFERSAQLVVHDKTEAPCQILSLSPCLSVGYRWGFDLLTMIFIPRLGNWTFFQVKSPLCPHPPCN